MSNAYTNSKVKQFFLDIYKILLKNARNLTEVWYEPSEIYALLNIEKSAFEEFLFYFDFIKKQKGNYTNYIVIDKLQYILEALKFLEVDIRNLSELLDFNGFEALVCEILLKHNYKAIKNFRFVDKSNFKHQTSQKKYEIDVVGVGRNYILLIDAKQWLKKDSFSAMNKAGNMQYRRVVALKKNPEVFSALVQKLLGFKANFKNHLPFILIPLMVTLEDNGINMNDNQVPLVSIYKFNAFLNEFQNYLDYYQTVEIKRVNIQKQLG